MYQTALVLITNNSLSGPAPLSQEKIDEIPKCEITSEQEVQCSVCWENFQMNESVRKLPCSVSFIGI